MPWRGSSTMTTDLRPGPFQPEITPAFKRSLRKKPKQMQQAIAEAVGRLLEDPRHPGLRTHKVQGTARTWECRIDQANRITWEYGDDDTSIRLLMNCNHDILKRA
jgi:mRNA interferase RelE/StbE